MFAKYKRLRHSYSLINTILINVPLNASAYIIPTEEGKGSSADKKRVESLHESGGGGGGGGDSRESLFGRNNNN